MTIGQVMVVRWVRQEAEIPVGYHKDTTWIPQPLGQWTHLDTTTPPGSFPTAWRGLWATEISTKMLSIRRKVYIYLLRKNTFSRSQNNCLQHSDFKPMILFFSDMILRRSVSKNHTPRRMLKKDLLIAKINRWNNSFQNMYDMLYAKWTVWPGKHILSKKKTPKNA